MLKGLIRVDTARSRGPSRQRAWWWALIVLAWSAAGYAQEFPTRPIRIVVATGPGGGTDLTGRNVAKTMSASRKYVEAGRLKGLAVSSASRASQMPGVPTINETGLVKFEGESWMGMFAPAATPAPLVDTLRNIFVSVARDPDFAARIENAGGRIMAIPPQQQQQFLRQEIERWGRLVAQYGVTAE